MKNSANAQKGTPIALNTNSCNTNTTKYMRKAEPISRDTIKKNEPVLCELLPKRLSR